VERTHKDASFGLLHARINIALGFVPFIMDSCMQGGIMGDVAWFENLSLCFNFVFFYAQG
jgi:hypothetical protein